MQSYKQYILQMLDEAIHDKNPEDGKAWSAHTQAELSSHLDRTAPVINGKKNPIYTASRGIRKEIIKHIKPTHEDGSENTRFNDHMEAALKDPDWNIRHKALEHNPHASEDFVKRALHDGSADVRAAAQRAATRKGVDATGAPSAEPKTRVSSGSTGRSTGPAAEPIPSELTSLPKEKIKAMLARHEKDPVKSLDYLKQHAKALKDLVSAHDKSESAAKLPALHPLLKGESPKGLKNALAMHDEDPDSSLLSHEDAEAVRAHVAHHESHGSYDEKKEEPKSAPTEKKVPPKKAAAPVPKGVTHEEASDAEKEEQGYHRLTSIKKDGNEVGLVATEKKGDKPTVLVGNKSHKHNIRDHDEAVEHAKSLV